MKLVLCFLESTIEKKKKKFRTKKAPNNQNPTSKKNLKPKSVGQPIDRILESFWLQDTLKIESNH